MSHNELLSNAIRGPTSGATLRPRPRVRLVLVLVVDVVGIDQPERLRGKHLDARRPFLAEVTEVALAATVRIPPVRFRKQSSGRDTGDSTCTDSRGDEALRKGGVT